MRLETPGQARRTHGLYRRRLSHDVQYLAHCTVTTEVYAQGDVLTIRQTMVDHRPLELVHCNLGVIL